MIVRIVAIGAHCDVIVAPAKVIGRGLVLLAAPLGRPRHGWPRSCSLHQLERDHLLEYVGAEVRAVAMIVITALGSSWTCDVDAAPLLVGTWTQVGANVAFAIRVYSLSGEQE